MTAITSLSGFPVFPRYVMDDDVRKASEFLALNGYTVTGITFDLFPVPEGLSGVGLLRDGREVRFFLPHKNQEELAVIGVLRGTRA